MYKLYQHQKEGVKYALSHRYSILADGMGLGKTLQAIDLMRRVKGKSLVVCPAALRLTWLSEISKFTAMKAQIYKAGVTTVDTDVIIVSYAGLIKIKHLFLQFSVVVADECHYLKTPDAQRTQHFHNFIRDCKPDYFLGLTGTPIKGRVMEFYSLLVLCSYNPLQSRGINVLKRYPSYWGFARHFSIMTSFKMKGRVITKFEGHRNIPELKELLVGKYLRRKASQVLDLPPIIRKDILLNEAEVDQKLLAQLDQDAKAFATYKVNNAIVKIKPTVNYCKDLLEQGEGPLVVFSDHIIPTQEISRLLGRGYRTRCITGEVLMRKREEAKNLFQAGELDVLVCTITTMSVGHTLTKASNVVFNDLSFVPGDIVQAEKRIHRIGQDKTCVIHRMFWGKMDAYLAKQLDKKIVTLKEVL